MTTSGNSTQSSGSVRTFRGRTLDEILPQIRAELGPDAIILREREGLVGGVGGFFAQRFVEVDARRGDGQTIDIYDDALDEPSFTPPPAELDEPEPSPRARAPLAPEPVDLRRDRAPRTEEPPAQPEPTRAPPELPPPAPAPTRRFETGLFLERLREASQEMPDDGDELTYRGEPVPDSDALMGRRAPAPAEDAGDELDETEPRRPAGGRRARPRATPPERQPRGGRARAERPERKRPTPRSQQPEPTAAEQVDWEDELLGAATDAGLQADVPDASGSAPAEPEAPPEPSAAPRRGRRTEASRDRARTQSGESRSARARDGKPTRSAKPPRRRQPTPEPTAELPPAPENPYEALREQVPAESRDGAPTAASKRPAMPPPTPPAGRAQTPAAPATGPSPRPAPSPRLPTLFPTPQTAPPELAGPRGETAGRRERAPHGGAGEAVRNVLSRLLGARTGSTTPARPPAAHDLDIAEVRAAVTDLSARGASTEWANQLITAAGAHAAPLAGSLREAAESEVARRILAAPALPATGAALAFIGAGGSGKTRCTAALASAYHRASTLAVTVIALDNPDGARELKRLLRDEQVPVLSLSVERAQREIAAARSGGLVIVDTATCTPTDPAAVQRLQAELEPLGLDAVYVTLPATLGAQAARRALASFGTLRPTAVAVTHADETDQLAVAIEIATAHRIPLAYLHAGTDHRTALAPIEPRQIAQHLLP